MAVNTPTPVPFVLPETGYGPSSDPGTKWRARAAELASSLHLDIQAHSCISLYDDGYMLPQASNSCSEYTLC